jgi:DNA-binding response OmpR family regulator
MGRILVVDDSEDICHALARLLRRCGHDVDAAFGGAEALATARAETPELIILDIMMPQMDGLEVLTRLKADESTAGVPVVMFSACQDAETVGRAMESGAIDFWRKASFNFNELPDRVRMLIEQRPAS